MPGASEATFEGDLGTRDSETTELARLDLGSQLSNKITVDMYQRHRDSSKPSPWQWREGGRRAAYRVRLLRNGPSGKSAALILSLSGSVHRTDLPSLSALRNAPIYEVRLTSEDPNVHFLRKREDLEAFRKTYRNLLSRLMRERPGIRELHVFPAVPAPVGVALGHDLLPKVHPALLVYDRDKRKGGFALRIKVNDNDEQ